RLQVSATVPRPSDGGGGGASSLPYTPQGTYKVHRLPHDKQARKHPTDEADVGWTPTSAELDILESFMVVHEDSSLGLHIMLAMFGCRKLRPLRFHFMVDGGGDVFLAKRHFRTSGFWCCPMHLDVSTTPNQSTTTGQQSTTGQQNPVRIGRVRENFDGYLKRCYQMCCLCTSYTNIDRLLPYDKYETRFTLRTHFCSCGRVNNCCAGTATTRNGIFDILDPHGDIVGYLQLWSTPEDRALLLTALFQIQVAFLEP
ncbi:hypothetical protein DYB36_013529, partial [Aphanomyces astaci]